jgi:hypothetical protein
MRYMEFDKLCFVCKRILRRTLLTHRSFRHNSVVSSWQTTPAKVYETFAKDA